MTHQGAEIVLSPAVLADVAERCGLSCLGWLPLDKAKQALAREQEHLRCWQEAGYAAEMLFMNRPVELLTNPEAVFPRAKSIVCFCVSYYSERVSNPPSGFGRVASYAWAKDYHYVLKKRLRLFLKEIEAQLGVCPHARIFTDAVPLLERAIAAAAGQGLIGKNSMLIRHGYGSYLFIAEILWNVVIAEAEEYEMPAAECADLGSIAGAGCGSCQRCLTGCPTAALISAGVVDSRKCISYLTIEKRGRLTPEEMVMIGQWVFGCDVCQETCPFNHHPQVSIVPEFLGERVAGPYIDLSAVLSICSDEEFRRCFNATALMRAGRESLQRNACCVVMNTRWTNGVEKLVEVIRNNPSSLVREQASYSLAKLVPDLTGLDKVRALKALSLTITGQPEYDAI